MEIFTAGSVVLIPFPFSDLSNSKLRPAVILAEIGQNDLILCQITSNPYSDSRAIMVTDTGFSTGSLRKISFIRPGKLFTANNKLVLKKVGSLKKEVLGDIVNAIKNILESGLK